MAAHRRQGLRLLDQAQNGPWMALVWAAIAAASPRRAWNRARAA